MRPISKAAQTEILAIHERKGFVLPEDVLQKARNPKNPLHHYIEWDGAKAAYGYQLEQCRDLIRRTRIIMIRGDNSSLKVRALLSVDVDGLRSYRTIQAIGESASLRAQVLNQIKLDLDRLTIKYGSYKEFWILLAAAARKRRRRTAA